MQTTETALARCLCWRKRYPVAGIPPVRLLIVVPEPPAFQTPSSCLRKNEPAFSFWFPSCVPSFLDVRAFHNGTNCVFSATKKKKRQPFTFSSQLSRTEST